MFSPATKRNLYRILPYGIIWFVFSFVYTVVEKGLLGPLTYYPTTGNPYNFSRNFLITPIASAITGLAIGTLEILWLNKLLQERTFSQKIIYKSLIYLLTIGVFLLFTSVEANAATLQVPLFSVRAWQYTAAFVGSYSFLSIDIYIGSIVLVSQLFLEISDNIGQGVLANFFSGKYHTPKEEERIFMFLDMKSSTTIAESLGHVKYFEMLKAYYADLTDPIIDFSGEIYQYVGDEIVVTWKAGNGRSSDDCLRCFFAMKAALLNQSAAYKHRFGVVPGFKAAFHVGKVTTGEIGVIKKDIIFTGDVLNTTARIQGLCNQYQTDILLSADLVNRLNLSAFRVKAIGITELRGRGEKMELFSIAQR